MHNVQFQLDEENFMNILCGEVKKINYQAISPAIQL